MDDGDHSRMVKEPRNRDRVDRDRGEGRCQRDAGHREIEDRQNRGACTIRC